LTEDTLDLSSILDGLDAEPYVIPEELPEEGGIRLPPPQPGGPYTVMIPPTWKLEEGSTYKVEDATVDGKPAKRPRFYFMDQPLIVIAAPPGTEGSSGLNIAVTISTKESRRGKDKVLVSDAVYFARAVFPDKRPTSLREVVQILAGCAGQLFDADVVYEANCNPKRDIYADGQVFEGVKGCGQGYGMRPRVYKDRTGAQQKVLVIPKQNGKWLDEFPCEGQRLGATGQAEACGALIRVFPRLRNFRAASPEIVTAIKGQS
jgi:hypothetical protein